MKLNVKNDGIVFGTNILDIRIPQKLRERNKCGIDYLDSAFGGEGFTPSTISLFCHIRLDLILILCGTHAIDR